MAKMVSKYESMLPFPRGSKEWEEMKIKPFTPNQLRALAMSNAPFNLWDGSIRSGKTFLSIAWLINKIKELPKGNGMILGQTTETIERNFLNDFMETLGESNYNYKSGRYIDVYYYAPDKYGRQERTTRRLFIVGAKDKKAIGRIRGSTLMLSVVDEASLMPKEVFDELVGRLSSKYATLLATTNPDSPNHWILKNYINHAEAGRDWRRFKFLLEDNLALDPEYVERIKRQYKGIPARYNRMIKGKWVIAEGVIYQVFKKHHILKRSEMPDPKSARRFFVGSDYGVENPTVFLLIGEHIDKNGRTYYVIHKEYYYSGKQSMKAKTTKQFADDFADFIKGFRVTNVVIDPSASALKTELNQIGIKRKSGSFYTVDSAKNDVIDGIQATANLIDGNQLFVSEYCTKTIEEFGLYSWDAKAQERGEDVPVKEDDHTMDALRYFVYTVLGNVGGTSSSNVG